VKKSRKSKKKINNKLLAVYIKRILLTSMSQKIVWITDTADDVICCRIRWIWNMQRWHKQLSWSSVNITSLLNSVHPSFHLIGTELLWSVAHDCFLCCLIVDGTWGLCNQPWRANGGYFCTLPVRVCNDLMHCRYYWQHLLRNYNWLVRHQASVRIHLMSLSHPHTLVTPPHHYCH